MTVHNQSTRDKKEVFRKFCTITHTPTIYNGGVGIIIQLGGILNYFHRISFKNLP